MEHVRHRDKIYLGYHAWQLEQLRDNPKRAELESLAYWEQEVRIRTRRCKAEGLHCHAHQIHSRLNAMEMVVRIIAYRLGNAP